MTQLEVNNILKDVQEMKAYHQMGLAKCQKIEEKLAPVSTGASKKKPRKPVLSEEKLAKIIARANKGRNLTPINK